MAELKIRHLVTCGVLLVGTGCSYFNGWFGSDDSDKPDVLPSNLDAHSESGTSDAWYNTKGIKKVLGDFEKTAKVILTDEEQAKMLRSRGAYLVTAAGACGTCHGKAGDPNTHLAGGRLMLDRFGLMRAANITPDKETGIGNWNVAEVSRAIRAAIDKDGRPLSLDLHAGFRWMSDQDGKAIATYLLSLDPIRHPVEHRVLGAFERKRWGLFPQYRDFKGYVPALVPTASHQYGRYLARSVSSCASCHTSGGFLGEGEAFGGNGGGGSSMMGSVGNFFKSIFSIGKTAPAGERTRALLSQEGQEELEKKEGGIKGADEPATETAEGGTEPVGDVYEQALAEGKYPIAGPDIRGSSSSGLGEWTVDQIITYLSSGRTPTGETKDGRFCPWPFYAGMKEKDKKAIALYLKHI